MTFWLCVVSVVIIDQFSKILMMLLLDPSNGGNVSLGLFDLRLVHNQGAAFGLLQGHQEIFIAVAIAALCAAVFYMHYYHPDKGMQVIMGLIIGGALGNLIDRIIYGYVVDFIDFHWWPVFNLADSAIVVGASLLAIVILVHKEEIEEG